MQLSSTFLLQRAASRAHNSASLIIRTLNYSDEPLARIFEFTLIRGLPPGTKRTRFQRDYSHVQELCHVCHDWRTVAKGHPQLWAKFTVDMDNTAFVKTSIMHSKDKPLDLFLAGPNDDTLPAIAKCLPRIRHMTFIESFPPTVLWRFLLQLTRPAPQLETFVVKFETEFLDEDDYYPTSLPTLFRETSPLLRALHLDWFPDWPTGMFRNLVNISLQFQPVHSRMSCAHFLSFLELNPRVETLELSDAGPDPEDAATYSSKRIVSLNQLKLLMVEQTSVDVSSMIMGHCRIPNTAILSLFGTRTPSTPADSAVLLDLLSDNISRMSVLRQVSALELCHGLSGSIALCAFLPDGQTAPCFHFDIIHSDYKTPDCHFSRSFASILHKFPLHNVRTLRLGPIHSECAYLPSAAQWAELFNRLPSLERLIIEESAPLRDILSALEFHVNEPTRCPRLRWLTSSCEAESACIVDFRRTRVHYGCPITQVDKVNNTGRGQLTKWQLRVRDATRKIHRPWFD